MLDADLIEQLKAVFMNLESKITLLYSQSDHSDQVSLLSMLESVSRVHPKLEIKASRIYSSIPQFQILKNEHPTGILFTGIPSGHEFSSLVLAILNADGKGKLPDEAIASRIKNLKGTIHLRTYISLTCENCPDVVQTLNQFALIHGSFTHEMVDGAYVQDEISRLGIQGVPSVVQGETLLSSGKIQLIDLLSKLEKHFGVNEVAKSSHELQLGHYDVIVVGSGPAGVSAAVYSARKGLKTAIVAEKMGGQVQDTKGIENLISVPYTEGPILAAKLSEHLAAYQVSVFEHRRVKEIIKGNEKTIILESGEQLTAPSVIVATGAKWRELNIPGEKQYLGQGVAFCPHCDGPFYKGKRVAVVGGGNSGVEAAIDLSGIVSEVTVFEFADQLKADQVLVNKLKSLPNARIIVNAKTSEILGDGKKVTALRYQDRVSGSMIDFSLDGIFVQIGLLPNTQFLKEILELNKMGEIVIDGKNRTSLPGVYAAGDVTTIPFKQIIISMGEGAKAALTAFEDRMLLPSA